MCRRSSKHLVQAGEICSPGPFDIRKRILHHTQAERGIEVVGQQPHILLLRKMQYQAEADSLFQSSESNGK